MTAALLYQPNQRSRVWIALLASALIHCAALAIAGIYRGEAPVNVGALDPEGTLVDVFDPPAPELSALPEIPETPAPALPDDNPFADNQVAPVAPSTPVKKLAPSKTLPARPQSRGGGPSAKLLALVAPRPEYPYEARRSKITGQGVAVMTVDTRSGQVIAVAMAQSTGSAMLDQAAMSAFRRWRFPAGTASVVRCPITYTLTGAML